MPAAPRLDKEGKPISLRLYCRTRTRPTPTPRQFIQGWCEQLGITVDARLRQRHAHRHHVPPEARRHVQGRLRHLHVGLGRRPGPDVPARDLPLRPDREQRRDSHYCNPEYDELLRPAAAADDEAERKRYIGRDAAPVLRRRRPTTSCTTTRARTRTGPTSSPAGGTSPDNGTPLFGFGTSATWCSRTRARPRRPVRPCHERRARRPAAPRRHRRRRIANGESPARRHRRRSCCSSARLVIARGRAACSS